MPRSLLRGSLLLPGDVRLADGFPPGEYEANATSSAQVWQDGAWKTVAVSLQTPGPWHNLVLPAPTKVDKIRYCITSIMATTPGPTKSARLRLLKNPN